MTGDKKAEKALDARERPEDREFEKASGETPFQKLVFDLPIRTPPLYVEQYMIAVGSYKLFTAATTKRFFCDTTLRQLKATVEAVYRVRAAGSARAGFATWSRW